MKSRSLSKYIGYSVSIVSLCVGTIFLFGLFVQATIPTQLRITCGVVFLLLGIYRYAVTRYKIQEDKKTDR